MPDDRNPLVIPSREPHAKRCCPACKGEDFLGDMVGGVVTFTCRNPACRNKWTGGLPRELMSPREPRPPENPLKKPLDFQRNRRGDFVEIRHRVDPTPDFRKGLPESEGEDE